MTPSVTIATVVPAEEAQGRCHDAEAIRRALATEGGHLMVGHGAYTIHYAGGWLSGCCPETVKRMCLVAGLPVIDARPAAFDAMARIAINGPLVAVGREASPAPYGPLSYAPLAHVAALYRAIGADVRNMPARCFLPTPTVATPRGLPVEEAAPDGNGITRLLRRLRFHRTRHRTAEAAP